MDNLRSVIELLFTYRDVNELLDAMNKVNVEKAGERVVDKEKFKELFFSKYHRYSGNQLNSLFDITNDTWSQNRIVEYEHGGSNVFNILSNLTDQMLVLDGGMPYCRYEEYLRWTEASKSLGEDIFVTNFLAAADYKDDLVRTDFAWQPFILTTNNELKHIMSKGLAELHNHLYGASLIFSLNWLALMNFPQSATYKKFKKITNFKDGYRKVLLAAFLRSILYKCVNGEKDAPIEEVVNFWLKEQDKLQSIGLIRSDVQQFISRLRACKAEEVDYAIPDKFPVNIKDVDSRKILIGERKLLYQCFNYVNKGEATQLFQTLFYIYLVIKAQFRKAMLQIDDTIGFENFQYYDGKKVLFVEDNPIYNKALADIAIRLAVQNTYVKYIEYRITPKPTAAELTKSIKYLDKPIKKIEDTVDFGFVVHFIKRCKVQDKFNDSVFNGLTCRNSAVRSKINSESYSVRQLITNGNQMILGIDAANSEFISRPEVFGTIFRRLRHTFRNPDMAYLKNLPPFKLGFTFHAGEDFYDIIDGLRAMEEAQIFLNLRNGDRIGHGTALGINVLHYYDEKHFTVVMPKQVMLDDLAWLIYKMEQYNVQDKTGFKAVAETLYYQLCKDIYDCKIDRITYINSWLLRGDEPSLYTIDGHEPKRENLIDIYQINKDNKVTQARKDQDARILYYRYHYDYTVKHKGSKSVEWKIDSRHRASFVSIIEDIQRQMQEEIAYRHIAIECNPTSNLRIGNIPRYDQHPIVRFNNEGLELKNGEIKSAAQISVSINTDDAGIFATSLEKEFTLMALALEKETDSNGEPKYQQRSVYRWLENIRENAFIQKFGEENNESRKTNRTQRQGLEDAKLSL